MANRAKVDQAERLANHFVGYLFQNYGKARHVRKVATWIGFLLKAIENVSRGRFRINRKRQIVFDYQDHKFKARYNHKTGNRGGIEIVEVRPGRGMPEGEVVLQIRNLAEAEETYHSMEPRLNAYISDCRA